MSIILLIESSSTMRPALQSLLENEGETVVTAMDVPGALSMLAHLKDIDLIIADAMMPQMDGAALVKRLRTNSAYETLPLLMFAVEGNGKIRKQVLNAGATAFLSAPFTVQDLQVSVKKLMTA